MHISIEIRSNEEYCLDRSPHPTDSCDFHLTEEESDRQVELFQEYLDCDDVIERLAVSSINLSQEVIRKAQR